MNIPLLFAVSVLPDVDLLIPGLRHRGPTHSVIVFSIFFLVPFVLCGKRAVPYFVALMQHSLIGDNLTGGTQLLWPASASWFGLGLAVTSLTNILIEWALFLASIIVMFKAREVWLLFQRDQSNLLLSIPIFAVLLPTFLGFPLYVPWELFFPHLAYIMLFVFSVLTDLSPKYSRR